MEISFWNHLNCTFAFVMFQSCAAGISNSLAENGESGGSAGLIVAIILLAGGIVSIATRNGSKGGNIALIVLFGNLVHFADLLWQEVMQI